MSIYSSFKETLQFKVHSNACLVASYFIISVNPKEKLKLQPLNLMILNWKTELSLIQFKDSENQKYAKFIDYFTKFVLHPFCLYLIAFKIRAKTFRSCGWSPKTLWKTPKKCFAFLKVHNELGKVTKLGTSKPLFSWMIQPPPHPYRVNCCFLPRGGHGSLWSPSYIHYWSPAHLEKLHGNS